MKYSYRQRLIIANWIKQGGAALYRRNRNTLLQRKHQQHQLEGRRGTEHKRLQVYLRRTGPHEKGGIRRRRTACITGGLEFQNGSDSETEYTCDENYNDFISK